MKKAHGFRNRLPLLFLAALLAMTLLTGCGAKSDSYNAGNAAYSTPSYYAKEEAAMDYVGSYEEAEEAPAAGGDVLDGSAAETRKLIKTYNLSVETQDIKAYAVILEKRVKELGGYIESSYEYSTSANYTIRIPSKDLENFVERTTEDGNVTSKSLSTEDVTLRYVDIESRVSSLEAEEKALRDILEKAETVEDIIAVQERLSEIRYQKESYQSTLKTLANQVDYSTIYLDVREVKVYTPVEDPTFGEKLAKEFKRSLNNAGESLSDFFVGLIGGLPSFLATMIILIIVVVIALLVLRVIIAIVRFVFKKRGVEVKLPKAADLAANGKKTAASLLKRPAKKPADPAQQSEQENK